MGWESAAGESHTHKLMRASVMELLDSFAWDDAAVAAEAKRRFDAHWEDSAALPSEYKTTVYRIVLMNGGLAEYEAILKEYTSTEDNQVRACCCDAHVYSHSRSISKSQNNLDAFANKAIIFSHHLSLHFTFIVCS